MLSRSCSSYAVALLVLGFSTTASAAAFVPSTDVPLAEDGDSARDFEVGARLVATGEVKLRDVTLAKGAHITIRGVATQRGRVATFDVELADGQVLKHIDAATIRRSFVAAND